MNSTNRNQNLGRRLFEAGNVFLLLFGAIGMVGVIGASTMTVMKGPVRTMSIVTKRTIAENNMIATGKLALIAAATQPTSDCDTDGTIEPIPFDGAVTTVTGGGGIPSTIGTAKEDPWGNQYAYCVWDHGSSIDAVGCGGGVGFLDGEAFENGYILAVISAGPDGTFQTSCQDDPNYYVKPSSSDDLVLGYTYAEAGTTAAGLWELQTPTIAEIEKDLEVRNSAGDKAFGVIDSGGNPSIQVDYISKLGVASTGVEFLNNIILGSSWLSGDGGNEGIQINTDGDVTTSADLTVTGTFVPSNLTVTNNATVGGTLDVTGTSTLGVVTSGSTITATDDITSTTGDITATAGDVSGVNGTFSGTLGVTGNTTIGGDLTVDTTTLQVNSTTNTVTINDLDVTTDVTVTGETTMNGDVTLGNNVADTITVGGTLTLTDLNVPGNTILGTNNSNTLTFNAKAANNLDMGSTNYITDLPLLTFADGTQSTYATSKAYVDAQVASGAGYTETDPQVGATTAGKWCITNGTADGIVCTADAPSITETDPQVDFVTTAGRYCRSDGTAIDCDQTASDILGAAGTNDRIQDTDNNSYIDVDTTDDGLTDSVSIATNGAERMGITSTGNIGLGDFSTDTIDSSLHIASGDVRLDGGASNEAGCLRFDDTTDKIQFSHDCTTFTDMVGAGGAGLWTDNTTHITRESFHVLDTGLAASSTTAGLDGAGVYVFYAPDKGAFRGGEITGANDAWQDVNIGNNSFAFGQNIEASGNTSTAMGNATTASGNTSTAMGSATTASGDFSTTTGISTTASGNRSTAMGSTTTASGNTSTAMGSATTASGNTSTAMGSATTASGNTSTAMGSATTASATSSTAMGQNTSATGNRSTAIGHSVVAGDGVTSGTFPFDSTNPTVGEASIAIGLTTSANTPGTAPMVTGDESLGIFMGNQTGYNLSIANRMALIGGDFLIDDDGTAGSNGCFRYDGGTAKLQFSHDCTTFTDMGGVTPGAIAIDDLSDAATDATSVFLGNNAGAVDDGTSNNNTSIGIDTLKSNTTGFRNVATGYQALQANIGGVQNTATGYQALYTNTTGNSNTASGANTLLANTTGAQNAAIGTSALLANTTGNNNAAIGVNALRFNTTGSSNSAVGHEALQNNTTASENVAIGNLSLRTNTTGNYNTAIGAKSLNSNTTGVQNAAVGRSSLELNTTGSNNTSLGYQSLFANTTGSYNIAMGQEAGRFITGGVTANLTGDYNIFLGKSTKALADDDQNEIVIGYNATGAGSNTVTLGHTTITKTILQGNVDMLGTGALTIPTGTEAQRPGTVTDGMMRYKTDVGTSAIGFEVREAGAWVAMGAAVSDKRLKQNIKPLNGKSILDRLAQIETYSYTMKNDDTDRTQYGVLAQELQKTFPELVDGVADDPDNMMSVRYLNLIAPIIEATKELKSENNALRSEISTLKEGNAKIQESLSNLTLQIDSLSKTPTSSANSYWLYLLLGLLGGACLVMIITRKKL